MLFLGGYIIMDSKTIGNRINGLLATTNVKQKELAQVLGVKDNIISYFCSGTRKPNIEQIIKMAKYFNVSTDYLLGLTDTKSSNITIKDICKYTGLSEDAIGHIDFLRNDFHPKIATRALNAILKALNIEMLISIDELAFKQVRVDLFKLLILKRFLSENYPNIPNKEIELRSTHIFDVADKNGKLYGYNVTKLKTEFAYYYEDAITDYSILDDALNCDLEYEEYKLHKEVNYVLSNALFEYNGYEEEYQQMREYYIKGISIENKDELNEYALQGFEVLRPTIFDYDTPEDIEDEKLEINRRNNASIDEVSDNGKHSEENG